MASIRLYSNEKYELLPFPKTPNGFRYAITNYGRVISYTKEILEGRFLKHVLVRGYPALSFKIKGGRKTFLLHRLVADLFLKKPSPKHNFVIHLNFKKEDNHVHNLKWATVEQKNNHSRLDRRKYEIGNYKLTAERVKLIKKKMLNGKTRLKTIAKQFGVSDMQIHRIKTGENWGYIKI
ncbi:MAG TPA: hypothetical protein DGG95_07160 [Cytophagales bacterium]|jgi:hypothetical protein|nr:hypothetical protein [Cytophagales bacterium]